MTTHFGSIVMWAPFEEPASFCLGKNWLQQLLRIWVHQQVTRILLHLAAFLLLPQWIPIHAVNTKVVNEHGSIWTKNISWILNSLIPDNLSAPCWIETTCGQRTHLLGKGFVGKRQLMRMHFPKILKVRCSTASSLQENSDLRLKFGKIRHWLY